jgi:hypothetical protein
VPPITNNDTPPAIPDAPAEPAAEEKPADSSDFKIDFEGVPPVSDTPPASPAAAQPAFNLDEEIKKIDRKELLKKAGVNDFAIEIDEYLSKGGKAEDYLYAKSIDYNKISDEDLVKDGLRKEYPGFSAEDINELFLAKYKDIDAVDAADPDKKRSELQLRADAFKLRQSKIEQQQKFKIPDTPILQKDEAYEQWKADQDSRTKLNDATVKYIIDHEATKNLHESKRVAINVGDGIPPFNFNVDRPELITQSWVDGGKIFGKLISTATGEPDVHKQQLITTFAANPQKFIQSIFNYGVSNGERKLVAEGQNAVKPQAKIANMPLQDGQTVSVKKFGQIGV